MLICDIDEKEDKVKIKIEGTATECTKDLSIELNGLLEGGMQIEFLVAALVHAVAGNMDQDDFNQTCEVISDLLKVIKDK